MKSTLSVTLIALAAIVPILAWYGLFASVTFSQQSIPTFSFVYQKHVGDYRQSARIIKDISTYLRDKGIATTSDMGLYYDNPRRIPVERLRFLAGSILPEGTTIKQASLKEGYRVATITGATLPTVRFPYKGKLSVVLGTLKVYPKLTAWFKINPGQEGPILEIYDNTKNEIRYLVAQPMGADMMDELWRAGEP